MIRIIISFISLFFLVGGQLYAQKNESIDFEKVYSFINSTKTNDTIKFNLSDNTSFGIFGDDTTSMLTDTLFNEVDRAYFRMQFAQLGKVKWQAGKIKGANVIPKKSIHAIFKKKNGWEIFREKYGDCLTTFSLPIFSKDFNYCVMYQWTQCDYLAGSGHTNLYKFENGKWIFVKCYMMGVS